MKLAIAILAASPVIAATPLRLSKADEQWVEKTFRRMTLEQKIGQLLIPAANASFRSDTSEEFENIRKDIVDYHVGGYHAFGGDPAAVAANLNRLQSFARIPLLITADLEGGAGYVMPGATRFPLAMAIAATNDPESARTAGSITAREGRAIGIHVNFYPVVDVNNNPKNPVISIRSFGEDVELVSKMARAYIDGAQSNGQIATAKHFPGHGDVSQDSHLVLPTLDLDRERLDRIELPPFRAAIEAGVGAVMSAHIAMPKIEKDPALPATLSHAILTGILRNDLNFDGLVFTDAMTMKGVTDHFADDEATIRAIEAGADVILFPPKTEVSFNALRRAVESGRISRERLDASVLRVLRVKAAAGLRHYTKSDVLNVYRIVGSKEHRDAAQRIAERAVTLVRDEKNVLPLRPSADLQLVHINLLDRRSGWREGAVGRVTSAEIAKRFPKTVTVQVDDLTTSSEMDLIRKVISLGDAVVVTGFIKSGPFKGSIEMPEQQLSLMRNLSKGEKPLVVAMLGSPYTIQALPELPSYLLGYDIQPAAELAIVRAITGEIPIVGKLPVSLPGFYPVGHGISREVAEGR